MPNYTHSVGVDVSKRCLDAYNITTDETDSFANNDKGIKKLITWLQGLEDPVVVIEPSGGYELNLQSILLSNHINIAKVNATRIRNFARSVGQFSKTDSDDARILALYGQKIEPKLLVMSTGERDDLSGLVTRRRQLVDILASEKNRFAKARHDYAITSIKQSMTYLKQELKSIDECITCVIRDSKTLKPAFDVITEIIGIGDVAGAVMLAELPELGHIGNKQISSLVGVAPFNRDSGSMEGQRHIYGGRHTVRCALYLVALTAIRYDDNIKAFYQSMKQKGKPSKVAIVACMRKILVIANAKLRDFYAK